VRPLAAGQQSLPRLPGKPAWPGLARPGHGSGPRAAPNCASFIRIADLFAISAGLSNLGLNALAAAISTPLAAPVIVGMRLRGGNAASARGAASFAAPTDAAPARGGGLTIIGEVDDASREIVKQKLYTLGELMRGNQLSPQTSQEVTPDA
jgi:hypothetical protein